MSADVEIKVVSALLGDRFLLTRVIGDGFSPEYFKDTNFRIIFKTVGEMSQSPDLVIDWITIENTIRGKDWFTPEIAKALERAKDCEIPDADQLMAYIGILKDRFTRDRLTRLSETISDYCARKGSHKDDEFVDFSGRVIQSLVEMQKTAVKRRIDPVRHTIEEIRVITDRDQVSEDTLLGYSIKPFVRLEKILSGLRKGFYYGVAGPPRRGKTTFTLDLASRLAEQNQFPVLFYTWEQTRRTLASRLLGRECYINPVALLTQVSKAERQRHALVSKAIERSTAYSSHLFIIEAGREDTIDRIKAQAYNVMHEFRSNNIAIFFDYLQKIPLKRQYDDIRSQVNEASAQLADLSLELECPVIAISSMDKEGCKLDEKPPSYDEFSSTFFARPTMHNCVGGGDLEYDLDVALVLSKDWVATKNLHERLTLKDKGDKVALPPQIDIVNIHVDKNRDSAGESSPTIQYAFFININKFVEVGFKSEDEYTKEFKGFAKAEDMFSALLDTGIFKL